MSTPRGDVVDDAPLRGLSTEFSAPPGSSQAEVVTLRSRWTRLLAWPWLTAAVVWTIAAVTHAVSTGRVPLDILTIPLLVVVAGALRRVRATVDADALTLHGAWRTQRLLWAAVERLEVDRRAMLEPAVHVWRRGDDRPIAVMTTWNAPRAELERFLAAAAGPIAAHRVTVEDLRP